ncbi:MAG: undecaprenyl diphosphate synthase [Lentimonas sp.]|jgi:undecaprenyl diphosphate synthase
MDGNGRWAKARNLPRIEGHRRGAEAVKRALAAAQKHKVKNLTLYAFSVENWNRPEDEVKGLMDLLNHFLKSQLSELIKRKVRLRVIGRRDEMPSKVAIRLREAEAKTANFSEYTLALALNYGSRTEVVDAVKAISQAAARGEVDLDKLDYSCFENYLYTGGMPDPDLIIRTSGEYRLSNFLMLQAAYSEIYFTPTLWPDFDESHFTAALEDYASRERRFGMTSEQTVPAH